MNAIRHWSLVTVGALGLMLGSSSALAQNYNETVSVTAPRFHYQPRQSAIGAPIENVSLSRIVRYDDLNLRTASGARRFEARVRFAAQSVCARLEQMYPITEPGSPPCIEDALARGMQRADAAIMRVRYAATIAPKHRIAVKGVKPRRAV